MSDNAMATTIMCAAALVVIVFCTGMMNNVETKWHIRELKAQTKLLNRIAVAVEKMERAR